MATAESGPMNFSCFVEICPDVPALAFAAEIIPGRREIRALCGRAVEVDDCGLIAGAWSSLFKDRAIERAATSVGTALRLTSGGLIAIVGTASASALFFCRTGSRLFVSNTLAFALAAADDRLVTSHPFYPQDLCTFVFGSHRYRHTVPTELVSFPSTMVRWQSGTTSGSGPYLLRSRRRFRTFRRIELT